MPSTTFNITPSLGFGANLNLPKPVGQMEGAGPLDMDVFFKAQATQQREKGLTQRAVQQSQNAANLLLRHKQILDQQQRTNLYKEKHIFEQEKWLTEQMSQAALQGIGQSLSNAQQNDVQNYGLDPTIPAQMKLIEQMNDTRAETMKDIDNLANEFEYSRKSARDVGTYARKINTVKGQLANQLNTPKYQRAVALNKKHQALQKSMANLLADGGYIINEDAWTSYQASFEKSFENMEAPLVTQSDFNPERYLIKVDGEGGVRDRLREVAVSAMGLTEEMAAIEDIDTREGQEALAKVKYRLRRDRGEAERMLSNFIEKDPELKYYVDKYYGADHAKVLLDKFYTAATGNKIVTDIVNGPKGMSSSGGSTTNPLVKTYGRDVVDNMDDETKQNLSLGDSYLRENGLDPSIYQTKDVIGIGSVSPNRLSPIRDAKGNIIGYDVYPETVTRKDDGSIDKGANTPIYRVLPNPFLIKKKIEKQAAEHSAKKAQEYSQEVNKNARSGMADEEFSNLTDASIINPFNSLIKRELGMFTDGTFDFVNKNDQGKPSLGHYQFNGQNANDFIDYMREKYPDAEAWESLDGYDFNEVLTDDQEEAINNILNNVSKKGGLTQDEFIKEQTEFWKERWGSRIHDEMDNIGLGHIMGNSAVQKFFYSTQNQSWGTHEMLPKVRKILGEDFNPKNADDLRKLINVAAEVRKKYVKDNTKNTVDKKGRKLHDKLEKRVMEERDEALKALNLYEELQIPIRSSIEKINRLGDAIQIVTSSIGEEGQKKYNTSEYYAPYEKSVFEKAGIDIDKVREGVPLTQEEYNNFSSNMLESIRKGADHVHGQTYQLPNVDSTEQVQPADVPVINLPDDQTQPIEQDVKNNIERKVMSDDQIPTNEEIRQYVKSNPGEFKNVKVDIPFSARTIFRDTITYDENVDQPQSLSTVFSTIHAIESRMGTVQSKVNDYSNKVRDIEARNFAKGIPNNESKDYQYYNNLIEESNEEIETLRQRRNEVMSAIDEVRPELENQIFFNGLTEDQKDEMTDMWLNDYPITKIDTGDGEEDYYEIIPNQEYVPMNDRKVAYRPNGSTENAEVITVRELKERLKEEKKSALVALYGDRFSKVERTPEEEQFTEQSVEQQGQTVNKVEKYGL